MGGLGNYSASLVTALFVMRVITVRFPTSSSVAFYWSDHPTATAEFWRSSLLSEKELSSSNTPNSHSANNVPLGLHPYLRNGGRSRLEIKVEFHEGAVPLSTLLAFYRTHFVCSLLWVWCRSIFSCSIFFSQGTWEGFRWKLCVGRYCPLTEVREIGPPYYKTKQMELILCQVLVVIGISASESKFSLQSLFWVVFIGV